MGTSWGTLVNDTPASGGWRGRGAKDHTVSWWSSWNLSPPIYWEGRLGIPGNALALRSLAKISAQISPLDLPPGLSRSKARSVSG